MSGFRPQLLPIALLQSQRLVINLWHLFSKCSFQVILLSRITPRYLARLEISRGCPLSTSVLVVLHLYRLVKMTTSVLPGFTESPVVWPNHSPPDHFTGCVVKGNLNIHECPENESFKVQWVTEI